MALPFWLRLSSAPESRPRLCFRHSASIATNIGVIQDPDHDQPWIIALPVTPGYLKTLDYSHRWGIEPMFSDFKSRGFGIEDSQIQHPDRLARLLLVMALALYTAVSTGQWDAQVNPIPAKKKT